MSLQLNFEIQQTSDCSEFILVDTTGTYSPTTNPTGFGAPNPDVSDIVSCTAKITDPSGLVTSGIVCTLPSVGTETTFDSSNLGTSGNLTEGVWTVEYNMVDNLARSYTTIKSFLFDCITRCCLDKAIADFEMSTTCTDCKTKEMDELNNIDTYLLVAEEAAECNKPKKANKFLSAAQSLCNQKKCNC